MSGVIQIDHHQHSIEKYCSNESMLLHSIEHLHKLLLTVQHVEDDAVKNAFKALVSEWNTMVVDHESSKNYQHSPDMPDSTSESKLRHSSDSRSKKESRSTNAAKSSHSQESRKKSDCERNGKESSKTAKIPSTKTVTDRKHSKSSNDCEHSKHSNNRENSKPSIDRETSKPAKEGKPVNGSESRKRKHESSSSSTKRVEKRVKSSDEVHSGSNSPTLSFSSRSTVSPPGTSPAPSTLSPKQESSSKDSKSRDKHQEKSHSSHKTHSEKSERSSEKSFREQKSSKSHHQKPKSEEKKNLYGNASPIPVVKVMTEPTASTYKPTKLKTTNASKVEPYIPQAITNCKTRRVVSLFDICMSVIIDNIDRLEETGGVPFYILEPVLEKATPSQLFRIEHHNPYLVEDTDALWQLHCTREFWNKQREGMESFRVMYLRCLEEQLTKSKTITTNTKRSSDTSLPARSAKRAYVDNIAVIPPAMSSARFDEIVKNTNGPLIAQALKTLQALQSGEGLQRP